MEIVIASRNVHKVREFKELFKFLKDVEVMSLHFFQDYEPPVESGQTFQENALIKARHAAKTLNKWVVADDSGLVVPFLKGAPGVRSSRYAGNEASDHENRQKLLREMANFSDLERHAYFECCLALCSPTGVEKCVKGICEGYVLPETRGGNGFGYDSLFVKHEYEKSFGELDESIKNRISHRAKAFEKLVVMLQSLHS